MCLLAPCRRVADEWARRSESQLRPLARANVLQTHHDVGEYGWYIDGTRVGNQIAREASEQSYADAVLSRPRWQYAAQ